ncbi:putative NAD-dependent protein deacetylase 1 [Blattamonas nauphoetae]|uniref:Regulatory protein SIR2 homolog 7 n=1 Tax=Blattamonas nauphoetae TaxID=2049346 RepID=A0ABQ9YKQ3_9EUKA|nr:putative NAD-dependent protein deacetylase 1 [Blattamonas nauphoetae]
MLKSAKNAIVLTGQALNLEAGLDDLEVRQTTQQSNDTISSVPLSLRREQAAPTPSYMTIAELFKRGLIKNVITTTIEGLHQRSGIPQQNVFEVFGNCFTEFCLSCKATYRRDYDVTSPLSQSLYLPVPPPSHNSDEKETPVPPPLDGHLTGRTCTAAAKGKSGECGGRLRDMIVHNGDNLTSAFAKALEASQQSDLFICIGDSLSISPICELPVVAKQKRAKLVIINTSPTPLDPVADCTLHLHSMNLAMKLLMNKMDVEIPSFTLRKQVFVGNDFEELVEADRQYFDEQNRYRWTVFVQSPPNTQSSLQSFIESVDFTFPPNSFKQTTITLKHPPFQVTRVGHTPFDVRVDLHVVANSTRNTIHLNHKLALVKGGSAFIANIDLTGLIE